MDDGTNIEKIYKASDIEAKSDRNIEEIAKNPKSALFKLAFPAIVSLGSIFFVTFMDSIWVSGLGHVEVSAVGLSSPIFLLLTVIGIGIGNSVNVSLSKSMAEQNVLESNSIVKNTLIMIIALGILVPLIVLPFLDKILYVVGAGVSFEYCYDYLTILILCMGIFFTTDIAPFFLRLQGYIKAPLYITAATCLLNVILDPIMIYTLHLGIKGAAIATVISAGTSAIIYILVIIRKKGKYISVGNIGYDIDRDFNTLKKNLKIAGPIIGQSIMSLIFTILLNRFFIYEGLVYITAYTFSGKIMSFISIPLSAFSSSMLSISGFLIGSHQWEEIRETFRYSLIVVEVCTIIPCLLFFVGSDFLSYTLYQTKDMVVINQISLAIKFLSAFHIFQAGATLVDSMFLSIEKPFKSFIIIFVGIIVDLIVLSIMVYNLHIINSVYYVLLIGSFVQITIYGYMLRKDLDEFLERKRAEDEDADITPN